MPLAAEYVEQNAPGGRGELEKGLLDGLSGVTTPHDGQILITQLGVNEIWTTNFDALLETAAPSARVICRDEQAGAYGTGGAVTVRMHGRFAVTDATPAWQSPPEENLEPTAK